MSKKLTVYKMSEEERVSQRDGFLLRNAIRSDGSVVTFNWHKPGYPPQPPHSHPFDQIAMVLQGTLMFIVDGVEYLLESGSAIHVPASVPHASRVIGDETVLNIDVFAPVREDYLFMTLNRHDFEAANDS